LDLGIFIAPSFLVISINKGSNILHLERKVSRQQKYIFRNFKKKKPINFLYVKLSVGYQEGNDEYRLVSDLTEPRVKWKQ
jgi:hypothetical protein